MYLEAAGKDIHQARNFAQPQHFAIGDIGHMHLAEERQQVVLTQAEHLNIFDNDHLIIAHFKQRALEHRASVLLVALG